MTIPLFAQTGRGRLTIADSGGRPILDGARGAAVLSDGSVFSSEGSGARVSWHVAPGPGDRTLRVVAEFTNPHAQSVVLTRMEIIQSARIPARPADLSVTQTGWQSWSPAGMSLPLNAATLGDPPMHGPPLPSSHPPGTPLAWAAAIHTREATFLTGFASAGHRHGFVSLNIQDDAASLSVWETGRVVVPPRGIARSEPVIVSASHSLAEAWATYAHAVRGMIGGVSLPHTPAGWCSWYGLGEDISEAQILETLDTVKRLEIPIEYIQIDDGYQAAVGDWLLPNTRFPNGLEPLARRIHEAGYRPGLWLAPFLISEQSALCAKHSDWLVQDHSGRPLEAIRHWNASQFVLDTTHPAALTWLRDVIRKLVHEWKFAYLKVDFLYAGTLPGRRQSEIDPIDAYRIGMAVIREASSGAYLLGCGAPLLPSAGLVDGMRVSPDVKPYWPQMTTSEPDRGTLPDTIRSVLAHSWTHRQLWNLDPDCAIVRGREGKLSSQETRTWLAVVAMSGGAVMLGDDLRQVSDEELMMLRRLLPPSGRSATPVGPFTRGLPGALVLEGEPLRPGWAAVALFNWNDVPAPISLDLPQLGVARKTFHLYDTWDGTHRGPTAGVIKGTPIEPHGVRMFLISPDLGRPQVIGSTLHILGGAVDVAEEHWVGSTLRVVMRCSGTRAGVISVFAPERFAVSRADGAEMAEAGSGIWNARVTFRDSAEMTIRWRTQ